MARNYVVRLNRKEKNEEVRARIKILRIEQSRHRATNTPFITFTLKSIDELSAASP